jgi:hypothetical protein
VRRLACFGSRIMVDTLVEVVEDVMEGPALEKSDSALRVAFVNVPTHCSYTPLMLVKGNHRRRARNMLKGISSGRARLDCTSAMLQTRSQHESMRWVEPCALAHEAKVRTDFLEEPHESQALYYLICPPSKNTPQTSWTPTHVQAHRGRSLPE